jgi:hypothetical protein
MMAAAAGPRGRLAMIKVYKSDAGQFVLVHPPSQTFIIEDTLEAGYRKMEAHLRTQHPQWAGKAMDAAESPPRTETPASRLPQIILIVFLGLLPFVWLLVLNHSLATLLTDVQFGWQATVPAANEGGYEALRQEVDLLRVEQNRLLQTLQSLNQTVEALMEAHNVERAAEQGAEDAAADAETASAEETPHEDESASERKEKKK